MARQPKRFKACKACRQKRARCNRQQPCQRCQQLETECVYESRSGENKSWLREERAVLESRARTTGVILASLTAGSNDQETLESLWRNEPIDQIARRLNSISIVEESSRDRHQGDDHGHDDSDHNDDQSSDRKAPHALRHKLSDSNVETASDSKRNANNLPAVLRESPDGNNDPASQMPFSNDAKSVKIEQTANVRVAVDRSFDDSPYCTSLSPTAFSRDNSTSMSRSDITSCTTVIPDAGTSLSLQTRDAEGPEKLDAPLDNGDLIELPYTFVANLIDDFFSRQDLPFPMISRDLFMRDFHLGKRQYCSSTLLRAICCLSCRMRAGYDETACADAAMGSRLFREITKLLQSTDEDECTIPDAQALGLVCLDYLGAGEYAKACDAAEEGIRRIDVQYRRRGNEEARDSSVLTNQANTLFGLISLARMVRLATGYVIPTHGICHDGILSMNLAGDGRKVDAHVEQLLNFPESVHVASIASEEVRVPSVLIQLTGWVYCFATRSHILDGQKLPVHLKDTYQACLSWYSLVMQRIGKSNESGPFVHLFFHFCLLVLFRPFCRIQPTESEVSPVDICSESAEAILVLTQKSTKVGDVAMSPFAPLFVIAAGVTEIDVLAGNAKAAEGDWPTRRRRSMISNIDEYGNQVSGRLLAPRARDQLLKWEKKSPASLKGASTLRSIIERRFNS